jgi:hypothetical protein
MVLYGTRSEWRLMGGLEYNLLHRRFVGFSLDEQIWNATTFDKNRGLFTTAIPRPQTAALLDRILRPHVTPNVQSYLAQFSILDLALSAQVQQLRKRIGIQSTSRSTRNDGFSRASGWPNATTFRELRARRHLC